MNQEILLMNFRIPSDLKLRFERICQQLRTNMTAEMNRMIRDFVKNSQKDLNQPINLIDRTNINNNYQSNQDQNKA